MLYYFTQYFKYIYVKHNIFIQFIHTHRQRKRKREKEEEIQKEREREKKRCLFK